MYNYCTQNHGTLVRFSFRVISDGKPYLTELDVGAFVALLYTDPGRNAATTASMMQVLDSESTGRVTWEAFEQNEKKLGSMLYPAFRLQKQLRRKVRDSASQRKHARCVSSSQPMQLVLYRNVYSLIAETMYQRLQQ